MPSTTFPQLIASIGSLFGLIEKCISWARSSNRTRVSRQQMDEASEILRKVNELYACCRVAQEVMDYLGRVIPVASTAYAFTDKIAEIVQGRLSILEDEAHDLHDQNWQMIQTLVNGIRDKRSELADIVDRGVPLPDDADFGSIRELARQFCEVYDRAEESLSGRNARQVSSRCEDMSRAAIRLQKLCSKMNHQLSHLITEKLAMAVSSAVDKQV